MDLPASLVQRLDRLAPDQRIAATAPPGPILCVAPAGSGKTTTLVARIAWLIATGVPPTRIAAITFNRRAAVELAERLEAALDWPGARGDAQTATGTDETVRVRTFHALGLEILRSTGRPLPRLAPRLAVLRTVAPWADRAGLARLDGAISRLKLNLDVDADQVAGDPDAGPIARAFVAYEAALARADAIDFDDLVRLAARALEADPRLLAHWRERCSHLLVDETQDVDRSQLRLALLLAAPGNQIFLVGDDDQSIYGWRLADVRRVLGLAGRLAGLRRIDLEVNYRCPAVVLDRAVRLVEHNVERFAKTIRPGPASTGRLVLAPDGSDEAERVRRVIDSWSGAVGTRAILARTNRELLPAAAVALERGIPFRASRLRLLLEDDTVVRVLEMAASTTDSRLPLLVRLEVVRALIEAGEPAGADLDGVTADPLDAGQGGFEGDVGADDEPVPRPADVAAAILAWAASFADLESFAGVVLAARRRLAALTRDDADLTLATAHATKGLEFDHVAVIGLDAGRFPSARAVGSSDDPIRAIEEERRLAYVAWTRARRSLTLVYDPATPSSFLLEAFTQAELALDSAA